jgi:type I restriction enzyme, S subunit
MKSKQVSEFNDTRLGELISEMIDHRGKTPKKLGGDWTYYGIPVLSAKNIKNKKLSRLEEIRFIPKEMADKWMPIKLRQNDVLITSEGATLGEVAILQQEKNYCIGQRLFAVRCDVELLDPYYFYYFLVSDRGQNEIFARATGSTVEGLRQNEVEDIVIHLPLIEIQKKIGMILRTLDDKIDNLQTQNKILEQIVQVVFKSWFIDFDGVKEFEDSELLKIPKGWEVKQIKDFCKVRRGASPRPVGDPKYFGGTIPWIKIADVTKLLSPYIFSTKETVTEEGAQKSVHLQEDSLIMSNSGTVGKPIFLGRNGCIHDGWLYFQDIKEISQEFLYFHLLTLTAHLNLIGDGTVQKNLNTDMVGEQEIIRPTKDYLDSFLKFSKVFLQTIKENQIKINTLTAIRDTLLPKLMSGEVRI